MDAAELQGQLLLAGQRQTQLEREIATLREQVAARDATIRELRDVLKDVAWRAETAATRGRP